MRLSIRSIALLAACAVGAACSHSSTASNGDLTATANDSIGDTFNYSTRKQWDISSLKIVHDTGGITVTLTFTTNVILPNTTDTNAVLGEVDFDVDQNVATGDTSLVDFVRTNTGFTGLGVDYSLDLFDMNADSTAPIVDSTFSIEEGLVKIVVSGKSLSARIPRSLLGGDDGYLNAAAVVGNSNEPTDIVPNNGHLHLGGTGTDVVSADYVGPTAVPGPHARLWPTRAHRPH